MLNNQEDLIDFIQNNEFMMRALKTAKSRNLPGWFIGAGFIRNTVWNIQHGYAPDYTFNDLDLGYFDPSQLSEDVDRKISEDLHSVVDVNWEVVNQAYAHSYDNDDPYESGEDGLAHWTETATCVAATLDENDHVKILAPWGTEDLLTLKLRIPPTHKGKKYYEELFTKRINDKKWLQKWPKLKVVSD